MPVAVVGDAMARPLADELAARPGEYDLSCWLVLGSGGALLSPSVRAPALALRPELFITDRFGSLGDRHRRAVPARQLRPGPTARLIPQLDVCVVDEQLRPVRPGRPAGSPSPGMSRSATSATEAATARTFPSMNGKRWAILGDLARVERDGSIIVLGRGSTCINTGGEKVFPEEVEQALKSHPAVLDALCGRRARRAVRRAGRRRGGTAARRSPGRRAGASRALQGGRGRVQGARTDRLRAADRAVAVG